MLKFEFMKRKEKKIKTEWKQHVAYFIALPPKTAFNVQKRIQNSCQTDSILSGQILSNLSCKFLLLKQQAQIFKVECPS